MTIRLKEDDFEENTRSLKAFAEDRGLVFCKGLRSYPRVDFYNEEGDTYSMYITDNGGRITYVSNRDSLYGWRLESQNSELFHNWLFPTDSELTLYQIETGKEYILGQKLYKEGANRRAEHTNE